MSERDLTSTDLPLRCQVGDCGNRAALTVTVELPTDWSESRTYSVVTLRVAACGDCARGLEGHGHTLLATRVQYARRLKTTADYASLMRLLLALIDAVGTPFEPVQGSTFATWLDKLDKPRAQSAWRLLAFVKRQTLAGKTVRDGWWRKQLPRSSAESGRGTSNRPLSIEDARLQRRALVPRTDPPPSPPSPPIPLPHGGGDDAA